MSLKIKSASPASGTESLLSEKEAAAILGLSVATLQRDRWAAGQEGVPPRYPYVKLGRTVRYRRADLLAVIAASTVA